MNQSSIIEKYNQLDSERVDDRKIDRSTSPMKNGTIISMDEDRNQMQSTSVTNETNSNKRTNNKRADYLIWEDYFMSVALLSAHRSKDPCTQVGACIVNDDNKIVSIGYNGMPMNCNDDLLPWGKGSDNELENKYLYVCHAELNAVLNCNSSSLKECTIYCTHFPCNECAKVIIQAGIKKVIFQERKGEDKPAYIASKRLLNLANVKLIHYQPKAKRIVLDLAVSKD